VVEAHTRSLDADGQKHAGRLIPEPVAGSGPMLTTTTGTGPDREVVGVARGNTVEARNVGRDVTQSLRDRRPARMIGAGQRSFG
jgi:hypothetical protein